MFIHELGHFIGQSSAECAFVSWLLVLVSVCLYQRNGTDYRVNLVPFGDTPW